MKHSFKWIIDNFLEVIIGLFLAYVVNNSGNAATNDFTQKNWVFLLFLGIVAFIIKKAGLSKQSSLMMLIKKIPKIPIQDLAPILVVVSRIIISLTLFMIASEFVFANTYFTDITNRRNISLPVTSDSPEVQLAQQYCMAITTQNYAKAFSLFGGTLLRLNDQAITDEYVYEQKARQVDQQQGKIIHCSIQRDILTYNGTTFCSFDAPTCNRSTRNELFLQVSRQHSPAYSVVMNTDDEGASGKFNFDHYFISSIGTL
jgi:hypothetical protein